eukprot:TRINITY_DN15385_c0_g1_i2.p1 TRINITY_DN15385_c0_g1~~TRINITY_DN15385_c0_g1_i2.p1  ORF type:complete len:334 (+),score=29.33 TRINITY_DN15385_c0_g1_i2:293-1294(+)
MLQCTRCEKHGHPCCIRFQPSVDGADSFWICQLCEDKSTQRAGAQGAAPDLRFRTMVAKANLIAKASTTPPQEPHVPCEQGCRSAHPDKQPESFTQPPAQKAPKIESAFKRVSNSGLPSNGPTHNRRPNGSSNGLNPNSHQSSGLQALARAIEHPIAIVKPGHEAEAPARQQPVAAEDSWPRGISVRMQQLPQTVRSVAMSSLGYQINGAPENEPACSEPSPAPTISFRTPAARPKLPLNRRPSTASDPAPQPAPPYSQKYMQPPHIHAGMQQYIRPAHNSSYAVPQLHQSTHVLPGTSPAYPSCIPNHPQAGGAMPQGYDPLDPAYLSLIHI